MGQAVWVGISYCGFDGGDLGQRNLGGDDVQEDRPRDNFGIDRAPRVRERGTRMRNRALACKNWHRQRCEKGRNFTTAGYHRTIEIDRCPSSA